MDLRPMGEGDIPPQFETLMLEKVKFAALQHLGPQVAHDMRADVLTDHVARGLAVRVQTDIMSYKDGEDAQHVTSEVEVLPHKRRILLTCVPFVILGVGLLFWGLHLFAALAFLLSLVVVVAYIASRDTHARKTFLVKAERWHRFPENNMVFPKDLGRPVIQIMTRVERD